MAKSVSGKAPAAKSTQSKASGAQSSKSSAAKDSSSKSSSTVKPTEAAKNIVKSGEIDANGKFSSKDPKQLSDIAQAALIKEQGLDPDTAELKKSDVDAKIKDIASNLPEERQGEVNSILNDPNLSEEEKIAKLGQLKTNEVDTKAKTEESEEAGGAEGGGEESEEAGGAGGGGDCGGAEGAGGPSAAGDKQETQQDLAKVIELINNAEKAAQSGDRATAYSAASRALDLIEELRSKAQMSGNDNKNNNSQAATNLANKIKAGSKLDGNSLSKQISGFKGDGMLQVLDALKARALRAMNGNSDSTLTSLALNAQQEKTLRQIGLAEAIIPLINKSNSYTAA